MGVTGGAHRLWSHRAYKATWQLRTILMLLQTLAFQVSGTKLGSAVALRPQFCGVMSVTTGHETGHIRAMASMLVQRHLP